MLDFINAIILGIVEGITEFLPISSTGHLILVNQFINFKDPFTNLFDIVIQLGAILAVIIYFFNRLFPFGKDKNGKNKTSNEKKIIWDTWYKTVVGVIPALILGAILGEYIEKLLFR